MKFRVLLATALLMLMADVGFAQNPYAQSVSQNQIVSTVAPPVNTPLLGSGLNCTAQTGGLAGTFAAGQLVVAYTYTGVASASESKASSDGGSTLTTVVTCPATGTLVVPSPPSVPGCSPAICAGWRAYAIASSSGTNAELLQTISALNSNGVGCILSTTSALTSCAIGQSLTLTSLGAGAAEPTNPTLFNAPVTGTTMGAFNPLNETGLNFPAHYFTWTTTGTAATCTFTLQNSADNVTYSTVGTAQTCTSSGSYLVSAATANFMRVNLTAFTVTGANVPSVAFTLIDFPNTVPVYNITNCGTTTTCTPNATLGNSQIKFTYGTCTAAAATTCVVTAMPAFTSTTSYVCNVTDQTTAANNALTITRTSATSITITTSSSSDTFQYSCVGT